MNNFASIIRLDDLAYAKVRYFTIAIEGKEVNEFLDFLNYMEDIPEFEDDLNNLLVWIEEIGNEYGAVKEKFRNEAIYACVSALPPPKKQMELHEIIVEDIRLYCFVANEHVVFLFNGGIKTKGINKAMECPNVGPILKQANSITKVIEELFKSKDIAWNDDHTDIIFDSALQFEI